jgi:hypothetical protein
LGPHELIQLRAGKSFTHLKKTCKLVFPKVLEPGRAEFGIADCVLDVLVPEIVLNRPRIVSLVGELVAAGMTEHVGVYRKG